MSDATIGYLGPPGSFAHQAVLTRPDFGEPEPMASVPQALAAVRAGSIAAALVPFENSIEGGVAATLDGLGDLSRPPLQIRGEVLLPVHFVLAVRAGTTADQVRTVATHPHAEAQCRGWLARELPGAGVVLTASTSTAAQEVRAEVYDAAVCAPAAAELYGLAVLADGVEDSTGAVTRFVVVARPGEVTVPTGIDRTTLVLYERDDHPGSLLAMLTEFAVRGVNLTRLESRPTGGGLGRYCFSLDCDGHIADARVGETMTALARVCSEVRFLGSYPRADGGAAAPARGMSDADFTAAAEWLAALRRGEPGR
ncbi:MAG TPA: prephenate dehydratase [Mycobacteriales bacterium]|jgi:prephenate dehydratase|nr:prephenate dehydratase [Mycobacteriales bacterium]